MPLRLQRNKRSEVVGQPRPSPRGVWRERREAAIDACECRGNLASVAQQASEAEEVASVVYATEQRRGDSLLEGVEIGFGIVRSAVVGQCEVVQFRSGVKR